MLLREFGGGKASQQGDTSIRDVVLSNMHATARIFEYLQWYPMVGNSDKKRKDSGVTNAGKTRSLDESYEATTYTPEWNDITLKILGDEVKVDIAHIRRGEDVGELKVRKLEEFGQNLGLFFNDQFINGDGTGENIHGINSLIPSSRVFHFSGENGGVVPVGTTSTEKKAQLQFIKSLVELKGKIKGGADLFIMNLNMVATLYGMGMGYVQKTTVQDVFGNPLEVVNFAGVPILDMGFKRDGTGLVIPNNMTCGTSSDCTAVYAVKFGQGTNLTAATNVGIDVIDKGIIGTQAVTMIDFDCDLGLFDDRAVAKLDGIRLEI